MDKANEEDHPNRYRCRLQPEQQISCRDTKLSCSLAGQEGQVRIVPGSQAQHIYKKDEVTEPFACSYGVNEAFSPRIQSRDLRFSGHDHDGAARMAELPGHPFYISTLFVPQRNSEPGRPHPLIVAYLEAVYRG